MGFCFRFETLLRVRKIHEDLALQEYAKVQKHLSDLEKLKIQKDSRRSEARRQLMQKMDTGLKSSEVDFYQSYLSRLEAEMDQLEKLMAQAGRQLDIKRGDLLKAKRDSKAIERLREIDEERYRQRQNKLEMHFMDEIAIQRYGSRQ